MSKNTNTERVFDEGVIVVLGEDLQPSLCIRKANGDGKISLYRMQLVGFEEMKGILQSLTQAPLIVQAPQV